MKFTLRGFAGWLCIGSLSFAAAVASPAAAVEKNNFKVIWGTYVGFMPWDYAQRSGILAKWADKYGITIELSHVGDYTQSLKQYTLGQFDACAMASLDMLIVPAAGGVDSTALIVGGFSNGNDGIVLKGAGKRLADIKGLPVHVGEFSTSHYLLVRGLDSIGLTERDIFIVNAPDSGIFQTFMAPNTQAVVTWKPLLAQLAAMRDASLVFDSSRIPGEIIDMMVVNTAVLKSNPKLGRALVGAWYETMGVMFGKDAKAAAALTAMARASGTDLAGFKSQLATTKMFALPREAQAFMTGAALVSTMERVRAFSFAYGLLGRNAKNVDAIGIEFPRGKLLGDPKNIRMRFDASYTQLAMDGKLQGR